MTLNFNLKRNRAFQIILKCGLNHVLAFSFLFWGYYHGPTVLFVGHFVEKKNTLFYLIKTSYFSYMHLLLGSWVS